jgi:hypothetical protein
VVPPFEVAFRRCGVAVGLAARANAWSEEENGRSTRKARVYRPAATRGGHRLKPMRYSVGKVSV